jgi:hypothetical protein
MLEVTLGPMLAVLAAGAATENAMGTGGATKTSAPQTTAIGTKEAKAGAGTMALTTGATISGTASER